MEYTEQQIQTIGTTERVASALSLLGCAFVIGTFSFSPRFRKPVNRLILYAVFGNVIYTVATIMAIAGVEQGGDSSLCQAQAFLIQAFLPADALWNLSMALNVYVTVFKHYDTSQLRAREPYYHLINYGIPFVIALIYCFVSTEANGKVYGNAAIWCWITAKWDYLRIATCYGPAWVCIIAAFTIYVLAGFEIMKKQRLLRSTPRGGHSDRANSRMSPTKASEFQGMSELSNLGSPARGSFADGKMLGNARTSRTGTGNEYSVTVSGGLKDTGGWQDREAAPSRARQRTSAIEANKAAWRYTKCALLFFASLLITWLPSSVNRVYGLVWPNTIPPYGLSYTASLVLPLTGFWNSIIYITTSWTACQALWKEDIVPLFSKKPRYDERESAYWDPPPPQQATSHRPQAPTSPVRAYSPGNRWEEDSDERGRVSPSDSLAGLARAL